MAVETNDRALHYVVMSVPQLFSRERHMYERNLGCRASTKNHDGLRVVNNEYKTSLQGLTKLFFLSSGFELPLHVHTIYKVSDALCCSSVSSSLGV